MVSQSTRRTLGGALLLATALATGPALAPLAAHAAPTGQGSGNPVLSVTPNSGISPTSVTTVQVKGLDYLVPPHAAGTPVFGGVYVFFGYVDTAKAWGPSNRNVNNTDGNFGTTYFYPGEAGGADTRDDSGGVGFVAFTEGGESGSTTDYHMNDNGDFTVPVKIPGAKFETTLPGGGTKSFDCLKVTCGIFTIGAHGKASKTNEKFVPITFTGAAATASPTPKPTVTATPRPTSAATSPTPKATTSGYDANGAPTRLPQTGIEDSAPGTVATAPLDGRTVAVGLSDRDDSGGGSLSLFGVAALVALVVALTASLFWRFGVRE